MKAGGEFIPLCLFSGFLLDLADIR